MQKYYFSFHGSPVSCWNHACSLFSVSAWHAAHRDAKRLPVLMKGTRSPRDGRRELTPAGCFTRLTQKKTTKLVQSSFWIGWKEYKSPSWGFPSRIFSPFMNFFFSTSWPLQGPWAASGPQECATYVSALPSQVSSMHARTHACNRLLSLTWNLLEVHICS